ncbi:hypothetical protein ACOME3_003817 [Neoechinorhynchus agilis]
MVFHQSKVREVEAVAKSESRSSRQRRGRYSASSDSPTRAVTAYGRRNSLSGNKRRRSPDPTNTKSNEPQSKVRQHESGRRSSSLDQITRALQNQARRADIEDRRRRRENSRRRQRSPFHQGGGRKQPSPIRPPSRSSRRRSGNERRSRGYERNASPPTQISSSSFNSRRRR